MLLVASLPFDALITTDIVNNKLVNTEWSGQPLPTFTHVAFFYNETEDNY